MRKTLLVPSVTFLFGVADTYGQSRLQGVAEYNRQFDPMFELYWAGGIVLGIAALVVVYQLIKRATRKKQDSQKDNLAAPRKDFNDFL